MENRKKTKKIVPFKVMVENISNELTFNIITRQELEKRTGGLFKSKTFANWDAGGKGPKRKIKVGRKVAYYVSDIIEFLENRLHVEEQEQED